MESKKLLIVGMIKKRYRLVGELVVLNKGKLDWSRASDAIVARDSIVARDVNVAT
jgi:hypothetical protein